MSSKTRYLQKKFLDHILGKASYTMPSAVYVALFTSSPGEDGSQSNEVTGTGYARQELTSAMDATVLSTGIATNNVDVEFGTPVTDWGTISYIGIVDAISGGNVLYYEALPTSVEVDAGDTPPSFATGQINIDGTDNDRSLYLTKKLIDHSLGIASYTMPTAYLGLFTASPGTGGSLSNEVSGGSYARQDLTTAMGATTLSTGIAVSTAAVTFPAPTANWGMISYIAVLDALTNGNVLMFAAVSDPVLIGSADPVAEFAVGSIQFDSF